MKIQWTIADDIDGRIKYTAHLGLIRATYWNVNNGENFPYEIYIRSGGRRKIILRVENNLAGPKLIDAKSRCEFLLICLDNFLGYEPLHCEMPQHQGTIYQPDNIPTVPRFYHVDGLYINRIYQHHSGSYYRLVLITNRQSDNANWPKTACYRNIFTGAEWSRPFAEFTEERYKLVAPFTKVETDVSFLRKDVLERTKETADV